jgi:hypothetical protein
MIARFLKRKLIFVEDFLVKNTGNLEYVPAKE